MRSFLDRHLNAPTVIALLALFVALGGGAYAVKIAKKNSVTSKSIKNGQVKTQDVADEGLTGADITGLTGADVDGLTGADIDEATLSGVPSGGPLESGQTMRGVWFLHESNLLPADTVFASFGFPVPLASGLANGNGGNKGIGTNNNAGTGSVAGSVANASEAADCTGTFLEPTAPAGKLCVYVRSDVLSNVLANSITLFRPTADTDPDAATVNRLGFGLTAKPADNGDLRTEGSWAYTAG